jgi:hypothetical protein
LGIGLLVGGDKVELEEESLVDSVAGIGTADTSEKIKAKIRATRPARE